MINLTMKSRIMFGVYLMCLMRKLKNPFIAESFALLVLVSILIYFVSIPSVLINMSTSESFYSYFMSAFFDTGLLVQSAVVLTAVTILFFVRNISLYTVLRQRLN